MIKIREAPGYQLNPRIGPCKIATKDALEPANQRSPTSPCHSWALIRNWRSLQHVPLVSWLPEVTTMRRLTTTRAVTEAQEDPPGRRGELIL